MSRPACVTFHCVEQSAPGGARAHLPDQSTSVFPAQGQNATPQELRSTDGAFRYHERFEGLHGRIMRTHLALVVDCFRAEVLSVRAELSLVRFALTGTRHQLELTKDALATSRRRLRALHQNGSSSVSETHAHEQRHGDARDGLLDGA